MDGWMDGSVKYIPSLIIVIEIKKIFNKLIKYNLI